jgi:hypothetical protein
MQRTADLRLVTWPNSRDGLSQKRTTIIAGVMILCLVLSALMASLVPLQFSIVTVFLFAGPHNWFELRYFLMRLPLRFGKSRNFFITAFAGIGLLTFIYIAVPVLSAFGILTETMWSSVLASWNTLFLLWLGVLVWQRGRQKARSDWFWAIPVGFGLSAVSWLAPEMFSLGIVYLHPLMALWFLDRHLKRNRPEWLRTYRRCLCLLPPVLVAMCWRLSQTTALPDDNGLFWRITQHAGVSLLPNISGHLLVSVHLFLEMLHYCVWLIALPLIVPLAKRRSDDQLASRSGPQIRGESSAPDLSGPHSKGVSQLAVWSLRSIPLARHPRGFPKLISIALLLGLFLVGLLWVGFSMDYSTTRDIYFTVAIAHVLAEAPFLLKML